MRAKRAHKHNMSTVTSSFNKLVRVDWSFVVTSAVSSSPSPSLILTKDFDEETATGNDDLRSRVNLRLVFENEEDDERTKRTQREIKMELTLSQFYEFKRFRNRQKSLSDDAEEE